MNSPSPQRLATAIQTAKALDLHLNFDAIEEAHETISG
jgi:hypothetical protein